MKVMQSDSLPAQPPQDAITVVPIVQPRAFEGVASQIRAHIIKGKLKPGDRLPAERELSAMFEVSRGTLREALRALELAGMIALKKGATGGAFVRHGDSEVVANGLIDLYHLGAITPQHLTQARIGLSEIVVRAACDSMTDEDLEALERNVNEAVAADRLGGFNERTRVHQQFHILLAKATRNPILIANMQGIMEIVRLFVQTIGPSENAYVMPSRRRLLKHLRARDAAAAVAEMHKTLERLHKQYLTLWKNGQAA